MRHASVLLLLLTLLAAAPVAHAESSGAFVAQLAPAAASAPASLAGPGSRRPARADDAAIAAAAPRLAALGVTLRRTLLGGLPAPALSARPGPAVPGFAPERIVLLEAADSASAAAAMLSLADAGDVEWAEPLQQRSVALESFSQAAAFAPFGRTTLDSLPDDPLLRSGMQWGLWNVGSAGGGFYGGTARADAHAPEAWHASVGADTLRLAVADTGVDPAHPELAGLLAGGATRIVDALNVTGEPVPAVTDSFGHGTPVAGVMAARTNDGPRIAGRGVAGVCGGDAVSTAGCRLVPIKIAPGHSGDASSFDIAAAVLHATDVGARAMNLSFAGASGSRVERLALTYAITRGCVVVVAAGNGGAGATPDRPIYPAAYAADGLCIQVGASDPFDARTRWSSYGPGLDLVAPGVDIWTTFMTYPSYAGADYNGYVAASGTSFAAPFVTGAVGLLAAARPELIDTDFQHVLRESADDIGDPGVDARTGWGRLNLARALDAVRPGIGIWHDEVAAQSVEPDSLSGPLVLGEAGPGTLDRWRGVVSARRFVALATVTLPDSFADSVRVWPRVGGTFAARGDYRLPYFTPTAQVIARTRRTFTLRGYLYSVDEDSCTSCPEPWIPLPPEYIRFGFTVLGPTVADTLRGPNEVPQGGSLLAGANPFHGSLLLRAPGPGRVTVLDALGHRVRAFEVAGGALRWDGRDTSGRGAPPGLYFVRWQGREDARTVRVVRLGP
jgi:subtilisin family serine protease